MRKEVFAPLLLPAENEHGACSHGDMRQFPAAKWGVWYRSAIAENEENKAIYIFGLKREATSSKTLSKLSRLVNDWRQILFDILSRRDIKAAK